MKTFNIMLNSINDVKNFVNTVNKYDFDVDLTSGRYVVDAKSIMGIFSLDLSKPIKLDIHCDDCEFEDEIKEFAQIGNKIVLASDFAVKQVGKRCRHENQIGNQIMMRKFPH